MSDPFPALPTRPLHPLPPGAGRGGSLWAVLGLLMFAGMLAASVIWILPDVASDWQVRDAAVPLRGAQVVSGKCSSKLFINDCDATLSVQTPRGRITRDVHYLFASVHLGDWTVGVVGDPQRPELVTTDLGLDYFWNRVLTLLVAWILLAGLTVGGAFGLLRGRRIAAALRATPMVPVPLEFVKAQKLRNGARWTVRGETGAVAQVIVPGKAKPFALGPGRILGLSGRDGAAIFPLDDGLRWVDLTAAERAAALR